MPDQNIQPGPWVPDNGDGTYKNPIIYADYSDPDIVRFGDGFYMTASSFNCTPGLPLLYSKDLVNWTLVGHICGDIPLPGYDRPLHGKGIWAPTFAVHDGKLYLYVCTPDEGLFMTCTDKPLEPWPALTHVIRVTGWIDSCAFWDDDGQAYLLHAFARSRVGICSLLHLCRMSPDGKEILDEGRIVVDVNGRHHVMEGPRMFRRGGYYYISAPAGGIEHGYQVAMRACSPYGPYEEKIMLHEGGNDINGPRQGGYVDLDSGESWFAHFQDRGAYGRVVNLEPVHWVDGWPMIGEDVNGDGIGEPVKAYQKPDAGTVCPVVVPQTSERFGAGSPGLQWQWHANAGRGWYQASEGGLRLFAKPVLGPGETLFEAPNLLLQKFAAPVFTAKTTLHFCPAHESDLCGLMVSGLTYYYLAVARQGGVLTVSAVKGFEKGDGSRAEEVLARQTLPEGGKITLQVSVTDGSCRFAFAVGDALPQELGGAFEATAGRWIGAKTGIFCLNTAGQEGGYADFEGYEIF